MRIAYAVIGMNYGDEGKGHITNYLSAGETLNIRFNGGSQAAHAVKLSNGDSHVFHHFGAGTLRGARTLLSRRFILNPIMYLKELNELIEKKVVMRETLVDPRCIVTTPYDILINHFVEKNRGTHTSTGTGINETVERSMYDQLILTARNIQDMSKEQLMKKIVQIENEWVPFRIKQLNYKPSDFKLFASDTISDQMVDAYINYSKWMIEKSIMYEDSLIIDRYLNKHSDCNIVFEGAQGMLLDQKRKDGDSKGKFLTRSNTGLHNVVKIIKDMKMDINLNVLGVTRTYLTRHGDGPFNNYSLKNLFNDINEDTNPENQYQGKMKYGLLDMEWYNKAIKELENSLSKSKINGSVGTAITFIDKLKNKEQIPVIKNNIKINIPVTDLIKGVALGSYGPTESDVKGIT